MKKQAAIVMVIPVVFASVNAAEINDYISGTSFESYLGSGDKVTVSRLFEYNVDDSGYRYGKVYWYYYGHDTKCFVTNIVDEINLLQGVSKPEAFKDVRDTNILSVDVSAPLVRTIYPKELHGMGAPADSFSSNIVADMVVQIYPRTTPNYDILDEEKISLWLYASEEFSKESPGYLGETDAPVTNLMITAGQFNKAYGDVLNWQDYRALNVSVIPGKWHRITIISDTKTIECYGKWVRSPTFRVYVDGVQVYGMSTIDGEIVDEFHSIMPLKYQLSKELNGIAFKGECLIDNISFTYKDPFTYPIPITVKDTELLVYKSEYFVNSERMYPREFYYPDVLSVSTNANSITFLLSIDAWAMLEGGKLLFEIEPSVFLWEKSFDITQGLEIELNVPLLPDEFLEMEFLPIMDGKECYNFNLILEANSGSVILLPENTEADWFVKNNILLFKGKEYAVFAEYYNLNINGDILTLSLNDFANPKLATDGTAFVIEGDDVKINVLNVYPQLYYGVKLVNTLGEDGDVVWAGKPGTIPTVKKPSGSSGFFRVVVTDRPIPYS